MSAKAFKSSTIAHDLKGHLEEVRKLLAKVDIDDLRPILDIICRWREDRTLVWVAGNGGSAANASHCTGHLREAGLIAICLVDNPPLLTANSNDFGYETAFSKALPHIPTVKDGFIVFSHSGESQNILALLDRTRRMAGLPASMSIGFFGKHNSRAAGITGCSISLGSANAAVSEDVHSALIHAVILGLRTAKIFGSERKDLML